MCLPPALLGFMAVAGAMHGLGQASKAQKNADKARQAAAAEQKREAESQKARSSLEALQTRKDTYSARRKQLAATNNFSGTTSSGFGSRSFFAG